MQEALDIHKSTITPIPISIITSDFIISEYRESRRDSYAGPLIQSLPLQNTDFSATWETRQRACRNSPGNHAFRCSWRTLCSTGARICQQDYQKREPGLLPLTRVKLSRARLLFDVRLECEISYS